MNGEEWKKVVVDKEKKDEQFFRPLSRQVFRS